MHIAYTPVDLLHMCVKLFDQERISESAHQFVHRYRGQVYVHIHT